MNESVAKDDTQRRVKRTAVVLGCIAFGFYIGFIVLSLYRARH